MKIIESTSRIIKTVCKKTKKKFYQNLQNNLFNFFKYQAEKDYLLSAIFIFHILSKVCLISKCY